jgi:hypothetical protein
MEYDRFDYNSIQKRKKTSDFKTEESENTEVIKYQATFIESLTVRNNYYSKTHSMRCDRERRYSFDS